MKSTKAVFFWIWMGIFLLVGCQSTASQAQQASNLTPTPTAANGEDYWELVKRAQQAYEGADYSSAMKLSRQAIDLNPDEETAWEVYSQSTLAQAGNEYLRELPETRYQLPVPVYIRDVVNHTRNWFVIDVREPDEFKAGHMDGAVNLPLREVLKNLDQLPSSKSAPILLYCHSQKRATHALVLLHELGYLKVFNLEGGYTAYKDWMSHNLLPTPGPTPTPGPDEPDFGC